MDPQNTELELKRLEVEFQMRREELQEKREARLSEDAHHRAELAIKRREQALDYRKGLKFSTAQATVAAAVLALASAVIGGLIQSWAGKDIEAQRSAALIKIETAKADASIALERQKFETTLILKATESGNRDDQIRNLKFFLDAGFISDDKGKLAAIKPQAYPSAAPAPAVARSEVGPPVSLFRDVPLRPITAADVEPSVKTAGRTVGLVTASNRAIECVGWLLDQTHVLTASFCIDTSDPNFRPAFQLSGENESRNTLHAYVAAVDKNLQYAILKLMEPGGLDLPTPLHRRIRDPIVGERIAIIQYGSDGTQKVSEKNCNIIKVPEDNGMVQSGVGIAYTCDNALHSGGAPIIATTDGALLGVHLGGTALASFGVRIKAIAHKNPVVENALR